MDYRLEWHRATAGELAAFSTKHQATIVAKLRHIAANIPMSLRLKGVKRLKGGPAGLELYEVDIGGGPRAAFDLDHRRRTLTVYLVGEHNYALRSYLTAARQRIER